MGGAALAELVRDGPTLSVGLNTADLGHLADEVAIVERGGARVVHIDVMDGVFVPMMTGGPSFVKAVSTSLLKDVHLMIDDPLSKVNWFVDAGADLVTFHVEAAPQPHRVLHVLGDAGVARGLALNPSTQVEAVEPLLDELDYVLVLAIDPGWGGQRFLDGTARRLDRIRELIARTGRPILLGVDGGVTRDNIASVVALGPDVIVSGSAIFDGGDAAANLSLMQAGLKEGAAG